jgi:hypothetical protein
MLLPPLLLLEGRNGATRLIHCDPLFNSVAAHPCSDLLINLRPKTPNPKDYSHKPAAAAAAGHWR